MEQTIYKPHSGNDFLADIMLSCPFCGGEPQLTFIGNNYSKMRKVEIKCKGCRVIMVNVSIKSGSEQLAKWSIEAWNKRVYKHEPNGCKHCGTHEKVWSRKNDDWYCKTCGHICR